MVSKIHLWDSDGFKILTSGGKIAFQEDCCCGCPEYADDFGRADSTDLGDDWTEVSGDWEIKSYQLYEPGTSGAIALYDKTVRTNYMAANITIMNEALGGVYRLYIAWADSSNHIRATYTRWAHDDATNPNDDWATLSLHSVIGGTATLLDTLDFQLVEPEQATRGFTACMDYSIVLASIDDNSLCHVFADPVEITDGKQAAVGHGNSSEVYFDNWSLVESTSEQYDDCPPCWNCGCNGRLPPRRLLATYDGDGLCESLDGISCELDLAQCGADALARYDGTVADASCLEGLVMYLKCGGISQAASAWELTLDEDGVPGGLGCAEGTFVDIPADDSSTCGDPATNEPFMLVFEFGPGDVVNQMCGSGCAPCGQYGGATPPFPQIHYYIIITERP